jgi:23S rRNA pseudouridine955/2504/2580 synthase
MNPLHAKPDARRQAAAPPPDAPGRQVRHLVVGEQGDGQRLDNYLEGRLAGVPRSLIHRIIRTGQVRVNGQRRRPEHKIMVGDDVRVPPVTLAADPARPPTRAARPLPTGRVPVMHEDEALIVLDKPAGLAVHGGSGIQAGLIEQLRAARPAAPFLELVHRLDRDTSGLLLVAKQRKALVALHRALAEGRVHKRYLALVAGHWGRTTAMLQFPLQRYLLADGERRVRVQVEGQAASTRVRLVRHIASAGLPGLPPALSLLDCELLTGRTHQIRVHLAHAGFPILGDAKYGDFTLNKSLQKLGHKRMFLHASRIVFEHPSAGRTLRFESPLPQDFGRLEHDLAAASADAVL